MIRTETDPATFASTAREVLKRVDRQMPLDDPTTMSSIVSQSIAQQRLLFTLLSMFAAIALILASVGIYSVVAYMVSQRTNEIGVRVALGAPPGNILRLIIGEGLKPVAIGVGAGVLACVGLAGLVQSQLYGVTALNPLMLAATSAGLIAIGIVACWLPARRALQIDPIQALKQE